MNKLKAAKEYRQFCRFLMYFTGEPYYADKAAVINADAVLMKPVQGTELKELLDRNFNWFPKKHYDMDEFESFLKISRSNKRILH